MAEGDSLRERLRAIPSVSATCPYFDTDAVPADPIALFREWLDAAIDGGVLQPLAMSLATATRDGRPSNRTVILKDVDATSFWFASLATAQKGLELAENPEAALVFYWREQGRQVRVVGRVERGPREVSDRDFLARSPNARVRAIASEQGQPLRDAEDRLERARARIAEQPDFVPEEWIAYRVVPSRVEFWQAERERDQVRVRYLLESTVWVNDIIWP